MERAGIGGASERELHASVVEKKMEKGFLKEETFCDYPDCRYMKSFNPTRRIRVRYFVPTRGWGPYRQMLDSMVTVVDEEGDTCHYHAACHRTMKAKKAEEERRRREE